MKKQVISIFKKLLWFSNESQETLEIKYQEN